MDNFSSEIGQKMRSAVKAKLIELGSGGQSGYIDDELPDYVMIMVANKRSKQQMITDLNLFLGEHTGLFVTWLHEVLHKLQEVTLPTVPSAGKKHKTSHKDGSNKKDKKSNKKDKKANKKSEETTATTSEVEKPTTTTDNGSGAGVNNITDLFAGEFLEKAKKTLDVNAANAAAIKKAKFADEDPSTSQQNNNNSSVTNEFDIPTISEISSTTEHASPATKSRNKDLEELAELQKKIYAAKKHLKQMGELHDDDDVKSDDADFLNLKDDNSSEEFNEAGDLIRKTRKRSPIVFDANTKKHNSEHEVTKILPSGVKRSSALEPSYTPPATGEASLQAETKLHKATSVRVSSAHNNEDSRRGYKRHKDDVTTEDAKKRPVHERLGIKPLATKEIREPRIRKEKEIYIPTFLRKQMDNEKQKERERDGKRLHKSDNKREGQYQSSSTVDQRKTLFTTVASKQNKTPPGSDGETFSNEVTSAVRSKISVSHSSPQRHRVGSRIIVAEAKSTEPDDELPAKPVNSVIKIKPRPPISPSKQACKSLLMRAMAEAQRSTILAKPKASRSMSTKDDDDVQVIEMALGRKTKLYSKSYRNRLKKQSSASPPPHSFRRGSGQNFVVEVKTGINKQSLHKSHSHQREYHSSNEDEYVPEPLSDRSELRQNYVPKSIYKESTDDEASQGENDVDFEKEQILIEAIATENTQFVVTLNDSNTCSPFLKRAKTVRHSRSRSPLPQVSSSSSISQNKGVKASSTTQHTLHRVRTHSSRRDGVKVRLYTKSVSSQSLNQDASERDSISKTPPLTRRKQSIKKRLYDNPPKSTSPFSPKRALSERESLSETPPLSRSKDFIENYRKQTKKIIIQNDSDDDELSPLKCSPEKAKKPRPTNNKNKDDRSTTPPLPETPKNVEETKVSSKSPTSTAVKRKHVPITFPKDNNECNSHGAEKDEEHSPSKRRPKQEDAQRKPSIERQSSEDRKKISIRALEAKKYDNIPSLNSVTLDSAVMKIIKPKERCKYHPNCTKQFCEYYHPTAPCKSFPNCKYADKCMYTHPKCKYDMGCTNIDCNFSHSGPRNPSLLQLTAPPLSSHVVPVQNYKSISATTTTSGVASTMCKFYPNCSKVACTFYHPKMCRFGKNCINKLECNFYHPELQSSNKFKWVSSVM